MATVIEIYDADSGKWWFCYENDITHLPLDWIAYDTDFVYFKTQVIRRDNLRRYLRVLDGGRILHLLEDKEWLSVENKIKSQTPRNLVNPSVV